VYKKTNGVSIQFILRRLTILTAYPIIGFNTQEETCKNRKEKAILF